MRARWRTWALLAALGCFAIAAAIFIAGWPRTLDLPERTDFDTFLRERNASQVYQRFVAFLEARGVGDVAPAWHLWRQGDEWRRLGEPAFAVPPDEQWPQVIGTLELVRDQIVPAVGAVEIVSGFRSDAYNRRAGGAGASFHRSFNALDLRPVHWITPWGLRWRLSRLWRERGAAWKLGLGLYSGQRFHVDTHRHRRW